MQINVLEYFEHDALAICRQEVAVVDQDRRYTFAELKRFAKNCAALILQRMTAINQPIAVFLPKSAHEMVLGCRFRLGHYRFYQGKGVLIATL